MKKYFFFDFDGTLTGREQGIVPHSTKKCINLLQNKGHFLCIATGRLQCDAYNVTKNLNINYLISDGGKSLTIDGNIKYMNSLNIVEVRRVLKNLEENSMPWGVSIDNTLDIYTSIKHKNKIIYPSQYTPIYTNELEIDKIDTVYKAYIMMTDNEYRNFDFYSLKSIRYEGNMILIEPMEKKDAIKKMQKKYSILDSDIIVFGDGYNDLSLFDEKWTCIAMGNANEELKKKATFITKNSWEDGITFACKKFGWL